MLFKNKFISGYCPRCTWQQSFWHEGIMFRKKHSLIKGTLILTSAGLVSRILGFFFRIFLSHTFGEEQVGLYQLISLSTHSACLWVLQVLKLPFPEVSLAFTPLAERRTESWFSRQVWFFLFWFLWFVLFWYRRIPFFFQIVFLEIQDVQHYYIWSFLHFQRLLSTVVSVVITMVCKEPLSRLFLQLIEQFVRISSVFVLYFIFIHRGVHPEIPLAVSGIIFGELVSSRLLAFFTEEEGFWCRFSIYSFYLKILFWIATPLCSIDS